MRSTAPLIGRDDLLRALRQALASRRLLTLAGPPGVGKSALAARLTDDTTVWCDLAPVADPDEVPAAVARAAGVTDYDGAVVEALAAWTGSRRLLLVLDGCEHVASGAAALVARLVDVCPSLTVVATSRQVLGLDDELVVRVPPLDATGEGSPAVELFAARAAAALPGFEVTPRNRAEVATICAGVGGLPLGIELAAARVKLLEPGQIAARLAEVLSTAAGRHPSLTAAFEMSMGLLDPQDREVLLRLSVLSGSFALDHIEAVVEPVRPLVDSLAVLIDTSWLTADAAPDSAGRRRYRLLEPVRQHARWTLARSGGGDEARSGLLDHCIASASRAAEALTGPARVLAARQIDDDLEHHRASLRWALEDGRRRQGLRLACALWRYWLGVGLLTLEGRRWMEQLLALHAPIEPTLLSESLARAGTLAWRTGDFTAADAWGMRALAVAADAGDQTGVARAATTLGVVRQDLGRFDDALTYHRQALGISRACGDGFGTAVALTNVGVVLRYLGRFAEAAAAYREGLALSRSLDADLTLDTFNLGELALAMGDLARARALVQESLETTDDADTYQRALAFQALGQIARREGRPDEARRWFDACLALRQNMGDHTKAAYVLVHLAETALDGGDTAAASRYLLDASITGGNDPWGTAIELSARGRLAMLGGDPEQAADLLRQSLATCTDTDVLGMVVVLERLAEATAAAGRPDTASRWWAAASDARAEMGVPRWRGDTIAGGLDRVEATPVPLATAVTEALGGPPGEEGRPTWPAPVVVVRGLGRPEVSVSGGRIARTAWTYTKAQELLYYLLEHPPATRHEIGLDLWPDLGPSALRSTFHRVLHALRRALGRHDVVVHADGRYGVDWALVAYDAAEFEAVFARTADVDLLSPADRQRLATDLEAVMWDGDFLAGVDGSEWLVLRREELARLRLEAMMTIGSIHFAAGAHETAARWYGRVIAIDPLAEEAHRRLMRCHVRLGERSRALDHLARLADTLAEDLGTTPSPETEQLAERIRRGDDV